MRIVIFLSLITHVFCGRDERFDGNDPKESYFRYIRTYAGNGKTFDDTNEHYRGPIPKPGGFKNNYGYDDDSNHRTRREVNLITIEQSSPLEIDMIEPENATEPKNDLVINDFIRFKRQTEEVSEKGIVASGGNNETNENENKNDDVDADNIRPKREHERNGKMLLSADETLPEGSREPRGATKDQWIKQPYPVQTTDPHRHLYDDNLPASSEAARAPRVHFVTQRRSESSPPLVYHSYEREGRSRELNRQRDMDLDRDFEPTYYPRPPRHYNPQQPLENFPYRPFLEPYYREDARRDVDRERYLYRRPSYEFPNQERYYGDADRQIPAANKQKRIIYYATLPEVVHNPSSGDFRDRFNYRGNSDRYNSDSRYITSSPVSVGPGINYRFRNENPYGGKSRYEDVTKNAYPSKVSSPDVNVREIKKNPERRIYSETDHRYPYKASEYRHGDYDRSQR